MKPSPLKNILLLAAPFALLAACAKPEGLSFLVADPRLWRAADSPAQKGISIEEYQVLISRGAGPQARLPVLMQMSVKEPIRSLVTSPRVELGTNKISLEFVRELRYASEFDPARTGPGSFPVIPVTPSAFESKETGFVAALTAKQLGGLILIEGEISVWNSRRNVGAPVSNASSCIPVPPRSNTSRS